MGDDRIAAAVRSITSWRDSGAIPMLPASRIRFCCCDEHRAGPAAVCAGANRAHEAPAIGNAT
jgi:hypothetical protein